MKILISSHAYAPSIGGIETVSALMAAEFVGAGHEVMVVTQSAGGQEGQIRVLRQPSSGQLWAAIQWCDVYWQNNLSLRSLWPAWILRRPVVITHQGSYCRRPTGLDLVQRSKHAIVRRNVSVAPSRAVARCFATESTIIPNPYDAQKFGEAGSPPERDRELIFLGRLVSEKGVDLLLEALGELRRRGLFPRLTIVGSGPEERLLLALTERLDLGAQVTYAGPKSGRELAGLLRGHRILVVPSRYDEPFGVVALEGIACGCVVVGSAGGGLPEAIGACGLTFPNGRADALAGMLEALLRQPNEWARLTSHAAGHLKNFHPQTVAETYLALFRSQLA